MAKDSLPAVLEEPEPRGKSNQEVWIRVAAFLALKSSNTQRTYRSVLEEWCSFLGGHFGTAETIPAFLAATDVHAAAYRQWLLDQPGQQPRLKASVSHERALAAPGKRRAERDGLQATLANNTISKKFAVLRRIYRVLVNAGVIAINPFASDTLQVRTAKAGEKRPTEMLPFEQVKAVLAGPNRQEPKGLRDAAILALLFGGGLRRSEVVKLRVGDARKTPQGTSFVRLRATKAGKDADRNGEIGSGPGPSEPPPSPPAVLSATAMPAPAAIPPAATTPPTAATSTPAKAAPPAAAAPPPPKPPPTAPTPPARLAEGTIEMLEKVRAS